MFTEIEWEKFTRKPYEVKAFQLKTETLYEGRIQPAGTWIVNDGKFISVYPDNVFKSKYE